jgi:hypothetical protein
MRCWNPAASGLTARGFGGGLNWSAQHFNLSEEMECFE